jgi:hypothetical protein
MVKGEKKQKLNITLSMVKILITLWMVYIYTPSHYNDTGVLLKSVAGKEGNRLGKFTTRPMVTLKQLQNLMAVIGKN